MNRKSSNAMKPICILPDKLYWISSESPPRGVGKAFFFNIDSDLKYYPFFKDFGPLNLAQTYRFVTELNKLLNNQQYSNCPIYHHTSINPAKKANAAYLMGAFQVLILKKTAEEAFRPFRNIKFNDKNCPGNKGALLSVVVTNPRPHRSIMSSTFGQGLDLSMDYFLGRISFCRLWN